MKFCTSNRDLTGFWVMPLAEKVAIAFRMLLKILSQRLSRMSGQIRNIRADPGQFARGDLQEVSDKNLHFVFIEAMSRKGATLRLKCLQPAG